MNAIEYIEKNYDNFVQTMIDLLKIPSISAQSEHKGDMLSAANFIMKQLSDIGLEPELHETPGHPIVYAEYMKNPDAPTALIYGHYDVQPVDPLELWNSPPFEPEIKDDIVYARGSADDKGQLLIHVKAIEALLKAEGSVPINFKLLFEGEEEIQSVNLDEFLENNKEKLACDLAIISDSSMFGPDQPALTYGLRGIAIAEVKVTGPDRDLHSGSYGGAVPNPIHELCKLIDALHDADYHINVPGFYGDVLPIEDWEKDEFKRLPFDDEAFRKNLNVPGLVGEKGFTTLERKWARPTMEVNGIFGGYSGEGTKTVLPAWAGAKITMRLVPDQDPDKICELLKKYLTEIAPKEVKVDVTTGGGAKAAKVSKDNPIMQAAAEALRKGFNKETFFIREGGSIPIVNSFKELLGVDTILLGFCQPDCNAHSPNEWFSLKDYKRGILTSAYLYKLLAEMKK